MDDSPLHYPNEDDGPSSVAFTPVPLERIHHNGWTERRQRDFITALAAMGSVLHAARAVGMSKQSAYKLRERPGAESFAAAWDFALDIGYADTFDRALECATVGIVTPRYYKGKQVGTRHRFDWRLAMTALNGTPPPLTPPPRKKVAR